jgi:major type 1 subunit fimbrin (pilin)
MKKKFFTATIFSIACLLMGQNCRAQFASVPNIITFNGTLTAATCNVTVSGPGSSSTAGMAVFTFPNYSTSQLNGSNGLAYSQGVNFTITVSGCQAGSDVTAIAPFFLNNPSLVNQMNGSYINQLTGSGAAKNIAMQIYSGINSSNINPLIQTTPQSQGIALKALANSQNSWNFGAVLYGMDQNGANAPATAGNYSFAAQYVLAYQ